MPPSSPNFVSRKILLKSASALIAAAALFAMAPGVAYAQDDAEEAIVVTGTRIPQPNLVTTSPVTQVTGEDIQTQGVTRVEDLTNDLPQVFASQGSNVSNGATGTAQVDLRGLGPARTLVLIDGRRMAYGSPLDAAADLNQIPGPLVERVEVLTGGASAVYGSDAIAGVVNFIMRDDFEGLRFDAQYGFYQHNNDFDEGFLREEIAFRGSTNPAQFRLPEDNQEGGYGKEITVIFGAPFADGRGNVTAYLGYRSNDAVLQRDRDYSACALGGTVVDADVDVPDNPNVPNGQQRWSCGGSATSFPGLFTDFATYAFTIDQATGNFVPFTPDNEYNYGPLNYYQRPDERYSFGAFARYEINDRVEAYGQLMFSDYRSVAQIAPSGDFFNTGTINCGNPLLTPGNAAAIGCTPADITADTPVTLYIGRRNVEGGGRQDDLNYESYRGVIGFRGPLTDAWDYDVSGQYSRVNLARTYLNDFSVSRLNRALDVVDADPGPLVDPQCRTFVSGVDPNCVPYDIFTPGGVTPEALAYLQIPLLQRGETIQQGVIATATGEFDFRSPMADDPVAAAFGVQYGRDELNTTVDENFATGNAAGQGGPTLPLSGEQDVFEVFAETRIPLIQNRPFADLVSMNLAFRHSDYSTGVETDTWGAGIDWAPTADMRFRGSYQRATRAANVIELFTSQGFGLFDADYDPCDATSRPAEIGPVPATCIGAAPYQVTAGQSTSGALNSPAAQYNALLGGNPDLTPEEADTWTAGVVLTPSFVPGLSFSIDYFSIEVANLISTTGAVNILTDCYEFGNLASCDRIARNPGTGQLWVGAGRVENLNVNIGGLETSGVDINANYTMDVGEMGGLTFQLIGTWLESLETDPGLPSLPPYDCVGGFGQSLCGLPSPEWRHRLRVGWETPWDLELFATWRYVGEAELRNASNDPVPGQLDTTFDEQHYLDLAGQWAMAENVNLRFGVNNVLDNDPPISANVGTGFGNGNTYPQLYDALGRWIFAGITVDF